jgi:hypothetical protein
MMPMTNNTEQRRAFEAIDAYFRSGNGVPVTRATIKLEEWEAVKAALAQRENTAKPLEQVEEWRHLDADLIERCKEVRRWQKSGILVENSNLEVYAEKYYSGLENNLLNAEADTAAQAMQAIIDLSAAPAPSLCTAEEAAELAKIHAQAHFDLPPKEDDWHPISAIEIAAMINAWAKR